jgi:hypothetical protein
MSIAATKPNKPAKCGYKNGNMVMVPDDELAAENVEPSPAIPSADAIRLLSDLVSLVADPKAAQKKVAEFADAANKARDAIREADRISK